MSRTGRSARVVHDDAASRRHSTFAIEVASEELDDELGAKRAKL